MWNKKNILWLYNMNNHIEQDMGLWYWPYQISTLPTYLRLHILAVLGPLDNCNIVQFTHIKKSNEDFDAVNKVAINIISDNMAFPVKWSKFVTINA